jgi:hypothetical protein
VLTEYHSSPEGKEEPETFGREKAGSVPGAYLSFSSRKSELLA